MQSQQAPRKKAADEKCHGRRQSAGGATDTSAQGSSGAQPTDPYKRYHWHCNDAGNRPAPQPSSDRGSGPYYHWCNGGVGRRQQDQADSCGEHRHAYRPEHSAGPSHGHNTDSSIGPMHGNQTHSGMGPRHENGQPSGSAPWPQNFPDGRHPMRPVASKDGLGHQILRSPSRHPYSDCRPWPYHWRNSGVGSGPYYHWRNGSVGQRQQDQADSHGEHRHAYHLYHNAGPSQGHKPDGNVGPMHGNQPDRGRRHGTGRPRGLAPWPGNLTDGRHPFWAVPGKDWLSLLPNTEEPMEADSPQDVEEPMEVDPPRPEQTWDYRGASLLSAIRAQKQCLRSARPAPYSLSRRLHPKH